MILVIFQISHIPILYVAFLSQPDWRVEVLLRSSSQGIGEQNHTASLVGLVVGVAGCRLWVGRHPA
jgi:hypothetical protein